MSTWSRYSSISFSDIVLIVLSYWAEGSLLNADHTGRTRGVINHLRQNNWNI